VMYSSTEKSFKDNWKKLQKKVKNPEVLQYLENTWLPLKEYYVPAWTNHHCHLGVGSTSRVEGAHAMVKLWLQSSTGTFHMAFRKQFIEIINRISKEMIFLHTSVPSMARCLIMLLRWPLTISKPNFLPMKNAPASTTIIKAFLANIRPKRHLPSAKGLKYQTSILNGI
ncbi:hypothetical protein O181_119684, partial [Austropuccinia psidii MF-1]|nr:hypothetical protein [Austropuccinia psidii MF-1]